MWHVRNLALVIICHMWHVRDLAPVIICHMWHVRDLAPVIKGHNTHTRTVKSGRSRPVLTSRGRRQRVMAALCAPPDGARPHFLAFHQHLGGGGRGGRRVISRVGRF